MSWTVSVSGPSKGAAQQRLDGALMRAKVEGVTCCAVLDAADRLLVGFPQGPCAIYASGHADADGKGHITLHANVADHIRWTEEDVS